MRRREFITLLGSGAVVWPLAAHTQQIPAIGYLSSRSPAESVSVLNAFRQGLKETGYIEGQNVAIEFRWAEGRYDRLAALASELVGRRVSVIVAIGPPTALAAKAATATIPIVFQTSGDPVEEGLVASLGRPGGNVTGVTLFTSTLNAKRVELLRELVPEGVIGALVNSNNPTTETQLRDIKAAARAVQQQVRVAKASTERDLEAAFAALAQQRISALLIGADPFFISRRDQLSALAARHRMPTIYNNRQYAVAGGLISYGTHVTDTHRQVGVYTGRLLKGDKPADLSVMRPTKFELVINLKTAKALGLTIPPALLARADEVIE